MHLNQIHLVTLISQFSLSHLLCNREKLFWYFLHPCRLQLAHIIMPLCRSGAFKKKKIIKKIIMAILLKMIVVLDYILY